METDELKKQSQGKWRSILASLGIEVPDDPKKHGPCPVCGPGNNGHRFRFDDKDGNGGWICTQCGSNDGLALVQMALGLSFVETKERVESVLGIAEFSKPAPGAPQRDPKKDLIDLYTKSKPIAGSDMVSLYLHARGLVLTPENVRFCPTCYNSDLKKEMPAMLATFSNKDGKAVSIHRTYLDGIKKADVPTVKKMMPGTEPLAGGAIRLAELTGDTLGVCEGVETAIACRQLFDIPTWATTGTSLLEAFVPPKEARKVIVFGDCDSNFAGQCAAYKLAKKLYNKPFELIVEVQIPQYGDWNDELKRQIGPMSAK